jgi:hypothetical protein
MNIGRIILFAGFRVNSHCAATIFIGMSEFGNSRNHVIFGTRGFPYRSIAVLAKMSHTQQGDEQRVIQRYQLVVMPFF